MKGHWHEQIQRYVAGDSTHEETDALQQALKDDAGLRALYLDYLNLDLALGEAAEAAVLRENGIGRTTKFPRPPALSSAYHWWWIGAAAACAVLVVFAMLPGGSGSTGAHPDIDATITSAQSAIARLSLEPPSPLPAWTSPTASLLEQPRISE